MKISYKIYHLYKKIKHSRDEIHEMHGRIQFIVQQKKWRCITKP